jgi:hypothetical protein
MAGHVQRNCRKFNESSRSKGLVPGHKAIASLSRSCHTTLRYRLEPRLSAGILMGHFVPGAVLGHDTEENDT